MTQWRVRRIRRGQWVVERAQRVWRFVIWRRHGPFGDKRYVAPSGEALAFAVRCERYDLEHAQ